MNKILAAALLVAASTLAHAESSAAKKELVAKVLQLQRPIVESQVRVMAERPAGAIMQSVNNVVQQRVPLEKREALIREVQADVRKYVEEAIPVLRDTALRLLPSTTGAVLEAKFSEAELKELVGALEAPAFRKYQQSGEEMLRPLGEKLGQEARGDIEPKLKALEVVIRRKLDAAIGTPEAAPAPAPAAKP